MTEFGPRVDLGVTLRALRRQADLSQRQLAERSGVPQATIARIESGRTSDPSFRTIERLVEAVGGHVVISVVGAASAALTGAGAARSLPVVPHEELRDAAGTARPTWTPGRYASHGTGRAPGGRTGRTCPLSAGRSPCRP